MNTNKSHEDQFREDFFKLVEGKKIRWSAWPESLWFIPSHRDGDSMLSGISSNDQMKCLFFINNGFGKDLLGNHWEWYDDLIKETSDYDKSNVKTNVKCECGLDSSGAGGKHATYCPKYKEEK